jgi:hypothetical protein
MGREAPNAHEEGPNWTAFSRFLRIEAQHVGWRASLGAQTGSGEWLRRLEAPPRPKKQEMYG